MVKIIFLDSNFSLQVYRIFQILRYKNSLLRRCLTVNGGSLGSLTRRTVRSVRRLLARRNRTHTRLGWRLVRALALNTKQK